MLRCNPRANQHTGTPVDELATTRQPSPPAGSGCVILPCVPDARTSPATRQTLLCVGGLPRPRLAWPAVCGEANPVNNTGRCQHRGAWSRVGKPTGSRNVPMRLTIHRPAPTCLRCRPTRPILPTTTTAPQTSAADGQGGNSTLPRPRTPAGPAVTTTGNASAVCVCDRVIMRGRGVRFAQRAEKRLADGA